MCTCSKDSGRVHTASRPVGLRDLHCWTSAARPGSVRNRAGGYRAPPVLRGRTPPARYSTMMAGGRAGPMPLRMEVGWDGRLGRCLTL
eukprot:747845-Hanusia_phi.AAC.5